MLTGLELFTVLLPSGVIAFVCKVTLANSTFQTPQVQPGLEVLKKNTMISKKEVALNTQFNEWLVTSATYFIAQKQLTAAGLVISSDRRAPDCIAGGRGLDFATEPTLGVSK